MSQPSTEKRPSGKLARIVPVEEIEANGFNLNISRYVQTGADAEAVDVAAEVAKLKDLIAKRDDAEAVMFEHLKRLGYPFAQRAVDGEGPLNLALLTP